MIRRPGLFSVAVLLLLGLAACGQMGPLYLPDQTVDEEDQDDEQDE